MFALCVSRRDTVSVCPLLAAKCNGVDWSCDCNDNSENAIHAYDRSQSIPILVILYIPYSSPRCSLCVWEGETLSLCVRPEQHSAMVCIDPVIAMIIARMPCMHMIDRNPFLFSLYCTYLVLRLDVRFVCEKEKHCLCASLNSSIVQWCPLTLWLQW